MPEKSEVKEFMDRFWRTRHKWSRGQVQEGSQAFAELVAWAKDNRLPIYSEIARAAFKHSLAENLEARAIVTGLLDTPGKHLGIAYFMLGSISYANQSWDEAIKYYSKVLEQADFDAPATALINLGAAYISARQYDKAIQVFHKATEAPPPSVWGSAWNNMGYAYSELEDWKRGIECYAKAAELADLEILGVVFTNVANAYMKLADPAKAIECYGKATQAFVSAGEPDRAKLTQAIMAAVKVPEKQRSDRDRALVSAALVRIAQVRISLLLLSRE